MIIAYVACLVFGLVLAVVSAVGGHGDADVGGHDIGHGDAGHDAGGSFPYFSPAVIGSFFAAFGAGGLIASEAIGLPSLGGQLAVAFGAGLGLAGLAGFLIMRVMRAAESTSQVEEESITDSEGEVVTEIPAGGIGEVAVIAGGARMTFPARSDSGAAIKRLALVEVTRVVGGTLYVREHVEERLRRLEPPDDSTNP
jgi:membrane protein implicated in regulation of membrane protease activity